MIELLYSKFYNELLLWCISLCRDRALSEDIVQEAFLRALSNSELLSGLCEEKCRAWLFKTAKNLFLDRVRRLSHEPQPVEEPFSQDESSTVMVRMLCERLPEKEKRLFIMRYFEGYNSTELGEIFDLPPETVRSRLSSARSKLRKMVNQ